MDQEFCLNLIVGNFVSIFEHHLRLLLEYLIYYLLLCLIYLFKQSNLSFRTYFIFIPFLVHFDLLNLVSI